MSYKNKLKNSDEAKLSDEAQKYKKICKCGHSVVIYPMEHRKYKLCSWCNNYVFINSKEELKYRVSQLLKKEQ